MFIGESRCAEKALPSIPYSPFLRPASLLPKAHKVKNAVTCIIKNFCRFAGFLKYICSSDFASFVFAFQYHLFMNQVSFEEKSTFTGFLSTSGDSNSKNSSCLKPKVEATILDGNDSITILKSRTIAL